MKWGMNFMVIVTCIVAAMVVFVLGLLFFRANGARVRDGRRDSPTAKSSMEDQKHRATGIN